MRARPRTYPLRRCEGANITTDFVLAEADYLILKRLGRRAQKSFVDQVESGAILRELVTTEDSSLTGQLIAQFEDQDFGVTDATLAALATRLRLPVLTLDRRHFSIFPGPSGQGLELLP